MSRIEKNIYFYDKKLTNKYCVTVKVAKKRYSKNLGTLEEARIYRDRALSLKINKCNSCGAQVIKFNTTYCSKCKKAYSKELLLSPVEFEGNVYSDRLTIDEASRKSNLGNIECKCYKCGEYFEPTRSAIIGRVSSLEGRADGEKHIYCSEVCKCECTTFGQKLYDKLTLPRINCLQVEGRLTQKASKNDIINEQLSRYRYTFCEKCGQKSDELELHHTEGVANNYSDTDIVLNPNTHILICKTCHVLTHMACK